MKNGVTLLYIAATCFNLAVSADEPYLFTAPRKDLLTCSIALVEFAGSCTFASEAMHAWFLQSSSLIRSSAPHRSTHGGSDMIARAGRKKLDIARWHQRQCVIAPPWPPPGQSRRRSSR